MTSEMILSTQTSSEYVVLSFAVSHLKCDLIQNDFIDLSAQAYTFLPATNCELISLWYIDMELPCGLGIE